MASIAGPMPGTKATPIEKVPAAASSFIASFEYDEANLTLTTYLKSGAIYQHKFVMKLEWDQLKTAKSHSKFWSQQIKGKKASVRVKSFKSPNAGIKTGR